MNAAKLRAEIERLKKSIAPTLRDIEALERMHNYAISREWIAANNVTAEQVQLSSGESIPWHGDIWTFGKWLKATGNTKRWAEWNGRLYSVAELKEGTMRRDAPGLAEHVVELPQTLKKQAG